MSSTGAAVLAALLLAPAWLEARTVTSELFGSWLERAAEKTNKEDRVDLKGGGYTPVSEFEAVADQAPGGSIRFVVRQYANTGGGGVLIRSGQALLQNHGTYAAYSFRMPLPQTVSSKWSSQMLEHKDIRGVNQRVGDHFDRVSGSVSIEDGHFWITAQYEYGNDDDYRISDRYRDLMMASRRLIEAVYKAEVEVAKQRWKEIEKSPVTSLDNAELMLLLGEDLFDLSDDDGNATVGFFAWTYDGKMHLEVINNGDELILAQWIEGESETQVAAAVAEMSAWLARKKLQGAQLSAISEPGFPLYLSVRASLPLAAGEYQGKQLRKAYEEFTKKFAKDVYKQSTKIMKKLR